MELLTTPTLHTFLLVIQRTFSQLLIFRMSSRHFTHQELYSMPSSGRNFLIGSQLQALSRRLLKTTSFLTTPCLQHTQYVRSTDIFPENRPFALTAEQRQRFTAVLLATTVLLPTGMMVRLRNTRIDEYITLVIPTLHMKVQRRSIL